jgi:hypothetical protein
LFCFLGHFPGVWFGESASFSVVWDLGCWNLCVLVEFSKIAGAISDVYLFCSLALGCFWALMAVVVLGWSRVSILTRSVSCVFSFSVVSFGLVLFLMFICFAVWC